MRRNFLWGGSSLTRVVEEARLGGEYFESSIELCSPLVVSSLEPG